MDLTCTRFQKNDIPYDALNLESLLLNFGVSGVEAKFPANIDNAAGRFNLNSYIVNAKDSLDMNFEGMFTVMFWAKFVEKSYTDDVYGNRFMIVLDDGTAISASIPSTVVATNWNHYCIIRDQSNVVTLRINGTTVASDTSSAAFNLTNSSAVYLGNNNRYFTGFEVVTDDIIIIDAPIYSGDYSDLPTDYFDFSTLVRCLYIITSTGEVWGYKEDV